VKVRIVANQQILYSSQPQTITIEEPINFCWCCNSRLRYRWVWDEEELLPHIREGVNLIISGKLPGYWQQLPCAHCEQGRAETEEYAKICDEMQKELECPAK
jgi:hypothetical protein